MLSFKVHYGFVLKIKSTDESSLIQASDYLERGINSDAEGVHDVRMYYHLGDALQRLGQNDRAYQVRLILIRTFFVG